jgi:hypothetical protein
LVGARAIKREVRCKTGAIPVAVSFLSKDANHLFSMSGSSSHCFFLTGRHPDISEPEDLPGSNRITELSGEKPEMQLR